MFTTVPVINTAVIDNTRIIVPRFADHSFVNIETAIKTFNNTTVYNPPILHIRIVMDLVNFHL
jgi:hypothetical protein